MDIGLRRLPTCQNNLNFLYDRNRIEETMDMENEEV